MSSIRISAKSIDDLNLIYKKVKKEFEALDTIKLNQETLDYEIHLKRVQLDGSIKAICDKVIDTDDLLDDESVFNEFTWKRLIHMMNIDKCPVALRPLKSVWTDLNEAKQKACFNYLCEEMEITSAEEIEA
ncbi:hypothetical protein [Marinoscillum pacificum]|uniref:hypothetical protein n=1 Tax=Marinoscillum pacificum TaxID=392723 RepID=UPI00215802F3|nr:hypothetical protein [Marinoscillum pacificum]